jgi:hypothetical protein
MNIRLALLIAAVLLVAMTRQAEAYLDANTGSLLIQLLVGGVAGIALVGKLMWHRITGIFRRDDETGDQDDH